MFHKTVMQTVCGAAVLAVALLLAYGGCSKVARKTVLNEGDDAPLFELVDMNGRVWNLEALRGNVVLINFWAPWCPPCREEMPSLQRLNSVMSSRDDFIILTVLYKEGRQNALQFMRDFRLTFQVLLDDDLTVSSLYGVTGVPETYMVGKRGRVRKKIIGPTLFDRPEAVSFITRLLNEQ